MSEGQPTVAPLARRLFGWAFAMRRTAAPLVFLGLAGLALVAVESAAGRAGDGVAYQSATGIFAAAGFLAVALAAILARGLARGQTEEDGDGDRP